MIEQFKKDVASGSLANVLAVNKNLSEQQEASLARLEDKWMSGSKVDSIATEERKPLMIMFDDEDNIVSTEVAAQQSCQWI